MQLVGPYRIVRALGSCQIGTVWAAVDAAGGNVTVAVLDAAMASDPKWRDAFSGTARGHARVGMKVLQDDFTAPAPWVAVAAGDGPGVELIFTALGQEYRPTPAPEPAAEATHPWAAPSPWGGAPTVPVSSVPIAEDGAPTEPMPEEEEFRSDGAAEPSRRRGAVIGWVIALIVLVLGIGGGVVAATVWSRKLQAAGPATPFARPTPTNSPWTLVTAAPSQPGKEPARKAAWPATWPKLGAKNKTQPVEALGLTFVAPERWRCAVAVRAADTVRYSCQAASAAGEITADILVRECPYRCDSARRDQLRRAEEAWGVQWIDAGDLVMLAETSELAGEGRHGLVTVMFGRTAPEEVLNREVVFRATSPKSESYDIRRVANAIHDVIIVSG